ncbi:MAG: CHAT domain-containing protein, partial [Thermoanaerobaculia bacterium]
EYPKAAAALSQMLLGPVARKLGSKRLLIVVDGALQYVPFAALPSPTRGGYVPLGAEHEVVSLPSASVLAVLRREIAGRAPLSKTLAVLADPVFEKDDERLKKVGRDTKESAKAIPPLDSPLVRSAQDLGLEEGGRLRIPRLPFTRREAEAIFSLAPAAKRKEVLDFDANRAAATSEELGQYRFVHFATHGFLNSIHPELSGLVLSLVDRNGNDQNGFLTALEVYNLKLPVDLVVLSGCRTGLGKDVKGEGLIGLTRGFMYAGAARVLVSLWDVDDEATAELMTRFYDGMLGRRHLSPAAALRAAQISISKEKRWQAPYYWAAFVLQGEPR